MTFAQDFSQALAASRARKGTAQPHAAPSRAAPAAPAAPRATLWSEIADSLNAAAGLKRGANIAPGGPTPEQGRARTAPPKAGAADWADIAAALNGEASLTHNRTAGA